MREVRLVYQVAIKLILNGQPWAGEVPAGATLLEVLRDQLGLMGTKHGCGIGECGACTVLLNGKAVNSCLVLAPQADGAEILTVEGLSRNGQLDILQQAFIDAHAVQCGYCTPGMLMSAKALLMENPHPTRDDIRRAISGNLCRCTGYEAIIDAIELAARRMEGEENLCKS
ncbi:MAG: aerobic carbon-monoxide dehydrogenase small subunit [Moorella sp. (in: firmicutes)]|nr:aerobic carbon-monoxide dehydrogenase small subunit [Moorella sp. (in: firmicutes)]